MSEAENEIRAFAEKRIGMMLRERYRLDALLGLGGMAAVYRGVHRNGHKVAIKMLHPSLAFSESVSARFLKEGYVANAVDHPGAVRVIDDDRAPDGSAFLVMELLEGETVDARCAETNHRLPVAEACDIALALLDVLAAAHAKGIIHRDIKPQNVFLTRSNEVKILDFGIARMHDDASVQITQPGTAMGTPAYMPPEQAMGLTREIDVRTDLWAVAAMLFTLISGVYVHEAETAPQLLTFAGTKSARSILSVAPKLSVPLAKVIDRALSFEKADRYANATDMRLAIENALSPFPEALDVTAATERAGPEMDAATLVVEPLPRAPASASVTPSGASTGPTAPDTLELKAASTTSGVSARVRQAVSQTPPAQPKRSKALVAIAIGAIALAGGALVVARLRPDGTPTAATPDAQREPAANPPPSMAPPIVPDPAVSVSVTPSASAPAPRPPVVVPPIVPKRIDAGAAPSAEPSKPSCDPPTYIDPATGGKKVKPGC